MELTLIRHGRSTADDDEVIEGGGYDAPLSAEGRRQAALLAERLVREDHRFDVLFASPLIRAREVADAIAAVLGLTVMLDVRLSEMHTGHVAGLTRAEAERINPRPLDGFRTYIPIPGGESLIDHYARTLAFYCELLDKRMSDNVCIIGHGGTIGNLLRVIYGSSIVSPYHDGGYLRFRHGDTAISRLTVNGPRDVLTHFLNDESHLRGAAPRV